MFNKIYNQFVNILTKNKTELPLIFINFDYQKWMTNGLIGSCAVHIHPVLADDEILQQQIKEIIDGIRERYDMHDMV